QIQPHETGSLLFHELGALVVNLVELLVGLVAFGLVGRVGRHYIRGGVEGFLPGRELFLEFLLAHAFYRSNECNRIPDQQVDLAISVDVSPPDARRVGGTGELLLAEDLAILNWAARFDEPFERAQLWRFALARTVPGPLHTAAARSTEQIEGAILIPVDHERVAVIALDPQRLPTALDELRLGPKLPLALTLEPVERPGEVAHDEIEVAIAIPIDREGPRADFLDELIGVFAVFDRNDERL